MIKRRSAAQAALLLLAAAQGLTGCAFGGLGLGGGGGVAGPPIRPDTSGVLKPFNDEPLAESITYGRTQAGNFHYRYFDRTTAAACVLEGVRGDVFVEYPTREQVRSNATFAQAPQTFAQPVALELQKGGSDLPTNIEAVPVGSFAPGGAADAGASSGLDVAVQLVGNTVRRLAGLVLDPIFGVKQAVAAADPEARVVTTYVRDGDLRCVVLMHSAQVDDTTRVAFERPSAPPPAAAPAPAPEPAPAPAAPAAPMKKPIK